MRFNLKGMGLCLFALMAGLLWNMGSDVVLITVHIIIPVLYGLLVAKVYHNISFLRKLSCTGGLILLSSIVRTINYSLQGGGSYVVNDKETQLYLLVSIGAQFIVALVSLCIVNLIFRRSLR